MATLAVAMGSAVARGDAREDARRHYDRALELLNDAQVADGIEELKRAYQASPNPMVLLALGRAYITVGKPVEAVDALTRYLAESGTKLPAAQRTKVEAELREQMARIGTVELRVTPASAAVSIDGAQVGAVPLASKLRVAAGRHAVVASLDGHTPATLEFDVSGGEEKPVQVVLQALPVPKGTVHVKCPVPDVLVTANGTGVGTTPLPSPIALRGGDYRIGFARAGYTDTDHPITVNAERTVTVDCGLKLLAPLPSNVKARLRIVGASRDIQTQVDGELVPSELDLPSGRHHVQVNKPGYKPWEREVRLRAGTSTDLTPEFVQNGDVQQPLPVRTTSSSQRSWAYAFGAAGLVLGAGALGVKIWNDGHYVKERDEAQRRAVQYNSDIKALAATENRGWTKDELDTEKDMVTHWNDRKDKAMVVNGIDIGLVVGAGALLCTGVILWLSSPGASSTESVALVPRRDGASVSWWGAFF